MPMDFPDMNSLRRAAEVHDFRHPKEGESESEFRDALATHVSAIDLVESEEIRNGVSWDKFTAEQQMAMLARQMLLARQMSRKL